MRETESLLERRLLPRADRELFQYEIVRFHLEELNALAERRVARGRGKAPPQDGPRVEAVVRAARWDRGGFLRAVRRFVDEGRAVGDDALGPALLLLALGRDKDPLLAAIAPSVRKLAATMLDETAPDSVAAPAPRRAPAASRAPAARKARGRRRRA